MVAIANPVVASIEDEEEDLDRENYDPLNDYSNDECAERFNPGYDREDILHAQAE